MIPVDHGCATHHYACNCRELRAKEWRKLVQKAMAILNEPIYLNNVEVQAWMEQAIKSLK